MKEIYELIEEFDHISLEDEKQVNVNFTGGPSEVKFDEEIPERQQKKFKECQYKWVKGKYHKDFYPNNEKLNPISADGAILNIDCKTDPLQIILEWITTMDFFYDFRTVESSGDKTDDLIKTLDGNVRSW